MTASILLVYAIAATPLQASEGWMPDARHFNAASHGQDCGIYRSLLTKTQLTLEQSQESEVHSSEFLKLRRTELVSCAESRGVNLDGRGEAEELAAEVCGEPYRLWLEAGFRLRALRQDLQSTRQSFKMLQANLRRFCGPSPSSLE